MNCYSCKKPLTNGSINYCTNCGAELKENSDLSHKHNELLNTSYSEVAGSVYSTPSDNIDTVNRAQVNINKPDFSKVKDIIIKNKVVSIIICAVLLLAIGGYATLNYVNGLVPKESTIRKDILGKKINIYGKDITIEDKNLKAFKLITRDTLKKNSDNSKIQLTLSLDNAEINVEATATYYFSKKWGFNSLVLNEVKDINPSKKIEDVAKGLISKSQIYVDFSKIKLDSDIVKLIEIVNVDGNGLDKNVKLKINLSNGIIKTTIPGEAKFEFSKPELQWNLKSLKVEGESYYSNIKYELEENVDNKALESYIKAAFETGINGTFKYKNKNGREDTDHQYIYKNDISELKITNYVISDDKKNLRTEIQGKCKNGDVKAFDISGVITVSLTFGEPYAQLKEINVSNIVTEEISDDVIKNGLLDKHVKSQIITTEIAKTFKVTNKSQETPFNIRVSGTIEIGGATEEIQFYVRMGNKDKQNKWIVDSYIFTKDSILFQK